jgi:hypothetical protein
MAIRDFGKSSFIHLQDRTGRIQAYMRKDKLGSEPYQLFKKLVTDGVFRDDPFSIDGTENLNCFLTSGSFPLQPASMNSAKMRLAPVTGRSS